MGKSNFSAQNGPKRPWKPTKRSQSRHMREFHVPNSPSVPNKGSIFSIEMYPLRAEAFITTSVTVSCQSTFSLPMSAQEFLTLFEKQTQVVTNCIRAYYNRFQGKWNAERVLFNKRGYGTHVKGVTPNDMYRMKVSEFKQGDNLRKLRLSNAQVNEFIDRHVVVQPTSRRGPNCMPKRSKKRSW